MLGPRYASIRGIHLFVFLVMAIQAFLFFRFVPSILLTPERLHTKQQSPFWNHENGLLHRQAVRQVIIGLVEHATVEFALNWLCSWNSLNATLQAKEVIFMCSDSETQSLLGAGAGRMTFIKDQIVTTVFLHHDGPSFERFIVAVAASIFEKEDSVGRVLLRLSKELGRTESSEKDQAVILAHFFRTIGTLAQSGLDIALMCDMRQVWIGDPLQFVHTPKDRGKDRIDDLQTIGHHTQRNVKTLKFSDGAPRLSSTERSCLTFWVGSSHFEVFSEGICVWSFCLHCWK